MISQIINRGESEVTVFGQFVLSGGYRPSAHLVHDPGRHGDLDVGVVNPATGEVHWRDQFPRVPTYYFVGFPSELNSRELHIPAKATIVDTTRFDFSRSEFERNAGEIDAVMSFWRWRGRKPQAGDNSEDLAECLADSIAVLSIAVP
jgi:hypothetical protein